MKYLRQIFLQLKIPVTQRILHKFIILREKNVNNGHIYLVSCAAGSDKNFYQYKAKNKGG